MINTRVGGFYVRYTTEEFEDKPQVKEDKKDWKLAFRPAYKDQVRECKLCGAQSGSSMIIPHRPNCKYHRYVKIPYTYYYNDNLPQNAPKPKSVSFVGQRENDK